jgi:hypothetical protein
MKKLVYLLTLLPMLVCAERAPGLTPDGGWSGNVVAAVGGSVGSSERLSEYRAAGDWRHFAELIEANIKKYPPNYGEHVFAEAVGVGIGGDSWALNIIAWDIFNHCDDRAVLAKALSWSELSIVVARPSTHPDTEAYPAQSVDTKANLLYKLGRVDEAIATEQAAIEQVNTDLQKAGRARLHQGDGLIATLEKMRKGDPTWLAK